MSVNENAPHPSSIRKSWKINPMIYFRDSHSGMKPHGDSSSRYISFIFSELVAFFSTNYGNVGKFVPFSISSPAPKTGIKIRWSDAARKRWSTIYLTTDHGWVLESGGCQNANAVWVNFCTAKCTEHLPIAKIRSVKVKYNQMGSKERIFVEVEEYEPILPSSHEMFQYFTMKTRTLISKHICTMQYVCPSEKPGSQIT
jgi:hypothetical protein